MDAVKPKLDSTLGAAFIGVVVAAIFHGISLGQTYYYFTHQFAHEDEGCSKDHWFGVKGIVILVIFFDTVHQALISHTVYTYVVTDFGQWEKLQDTVWSLLVEVLFNGFTALLVQGFLAMRVWKLSGRNKYLTGIVCCLIVAEMGCVLAFGIIGLTNPLTFAFLASLKTLSITVNALAAAGDIIITVSLVWMLQRSKTGFSRSQRMINRLTAFSVNTGLLTTLCAIASLVSIATRPEAFIYIAFFFCIGRLYANSLLATLNARRSIRSSSAGGIVNSTSESQWKDVGLSFSMTSIGPKESTRSFGSVSSSTAKGSKSPSQPRLNDTGTHPSLSGISIKIDTTKEYSSDPAILRSKSQMLKDVDAEKGELKHDKEIECTSGPGVVSFGSLATQ